MATELSLNQWVWLNRQQEKYTSGVKKVNEGIQFLSEYQDEKMEVAHELTKELRVLGKQIYHLEGHAEEIKCLQQQYALFSPLQGSETVVLDNTGIQGPAPIVQPAFIPSFNWLQKTSLREMKIHQMTQINLRRDVNLYCLGFAFSNGSMSPPLECYPESNPKAHNWLTYDIPEGVHVGKIVFGVYKKTEYQERLGLCRVQMFEQQTDSLLCDVKGKWKDRESVEVVLAESEKFVSAKVETRGNDAVNVSFIIFDEHKQSLLTDFVPFDPEFINKVDIPQHEYAVQGGQFAIENDKDNETLPMAIKDSKDLKIVEEQEEEHDKVLQTENDTM